jgi:hypothetical protein
MLQPLHEPQITSHVIPALVPKTLNNGEVLFYQVSMYSRAQEQQFVCKELSQ